MSEATSDFIDEFPIVSGPGMDEVVETRALSSMIQKLYVDVSNYFKWC